MIYTFSDFSLNTNTKELQFNTEVISLTKQTYELLLFFIKNPNIVFSKEDIINAVWKGKYVTENSIDQSISKIRKILNKKQKDTYIQTVYGKGFKFVPVVSNINKSENNTIKTNVQNKNNLYKYIVYSIVALLLISSYLYFKPNHSDSFYLPNSQIMIITEDSPDDEKWLNQASISLFDQMINYSNTAKIKTYNNKPDYLEKKQYINNQLKISPNLKVITTKITFNNNKYTVNLNLQNSSNTHTDKSFSDVNLGKAIKAASHWIATVANEKPINNNNKIESLLPQDSYIVELYMRGLTSYGNENFEKAEHFLKLCLSEKPDFYLARIQLARVKRAQGKTQKALSLLDTLSNLPIFPQIEIEIATIRGDIYDTQGKHKEAKDIYLAIIEKYKHKSNTQLTDIHYNLAYSYTFLTEYQKALEELSFLEVSVQESEDMELLANVFQKKAGILQKLGYIQKAEINANRALQLFSKLDDLLGEAKIYTTLANITTFQGKYKESINYLVQAININRNLGYKLGVGATINQLIYVLMVQGEFSKALEANQEMQKIAIEIDFNAMLQISKQYAVDIARAQKKWQAAKINLKQHKQLAQASNNKGALLKNKLLAIELYLDMGKTDSIKTLIDVIQKHIDETGEIRLQSRINKMLGRYYLLIGQNDDALQVLNLAKSEALTTKDSESLLEIDNLLAEHYLENDQAEKALQILNEQNGKSSLPYPNLLIKSKTQAALKNSLKAQDLANECKLLANEFWTIEDEKYLISLNNN